MSLLRSAPLYSQVRDELARQIAEQKFPTGSVLPNEFVLAETMGVSVGTVRKALDILRMEKIVTRSQGRGTVVAGVGSSDFRGKFDGVRNADGSTVGWRFELIQRNARRADATERDILTLDDGADIVELIRLRKADGRTVQREHSRIPLSAFGDLASLDPADTTVESLAYRNGVLVSLLEERVALVQASAELADQFGVIEGSPLLRLERMVFGGEGKPLEWRIAFCHVDGYCYHASAAIHVRQPSPRRAVRLVDNAPDPQNWRGKTP